MLNIEETWITAHYMQTLYNDAHQIPAQTKYMKDKYSVSHHNQDHQLDFH